MQINESVNPPKSGRHNASCPICAGENTPKLLNYDTKHGALKDEKALGKNLRASGEIKDDDGHTIHPFKGGKDDHQGWQVDKGVLEPIVVIVKPTPHHLIPGNAAMAPSKLEKWTTTSKGPKLKQDIGYDIDCTLNGIWLPHLPHVYWTSYKTQTKRWCDIYGKWSELDPDEQEFVGKVVMGETSLQMHYTDHDDPYIDMPHNTTYDGEAKKRCDMLAQLMDKFWSIKCKKSKGSDGKLRPPYGLVERINLQSEFMRKRITGPPGRWKSFVSPLAQVFAKGVRTGKIKLKPKGVVSAI